MRSTVPTVTGDRAVNELGRVLPHEHFFVLAESVTEQFPDLWDEQGARDRALERARALRDRGFETIFDPTPPGLGRRVTQVREIARETGLQVLAATGYYTWTELPSYFQLRSEKALRDVFVEELEEGIQQTDIRAAFIKVVTDEPGVVFDVEKIIRAAALAHHETGAPIMTHSNPHNRSGVEQQNILEDEGVDLSHVVIGHCGDSQDLDLLMEIADRGSYLGMDRFGVEAMLGLEERIQTVVDLCEEGYTDRIHLSHDSNCTPELTPEEYRQHMHPDWGPTLIPDTVLPALRDAGITEGQIETMVRENPRRWIEGSG